MIDKRANFKQLQGQDEKYRNEDYVRKMLVERNREELKKIKNIHDLSDEQIELFCDFAELRDNTLKDMRQKLETRELVQPQASQEELNIGAYLEQIEPQAREAVLALRHKGYTTYESGFGNFDSQRISFEAEHLKGFKPSEKIQAELEKYSARLIIKPKSVEIKFSKFQELKIIKDIWQQVVGELPLLGEEAKPSDIKAAQLFRKKQSAIVRGL